MCVHMETRSHQEAEDRKKVLLNSSQTVDLTAHCPCNFTSQDCGTIHLCDITYPTRLTCGFQTYFCHNRVTDFDSVHACLIAPGLATGEPSLVPVCSQHTQCVRPLNHYPKTMPQAQPDLLNHGYIFSHRPKTLQFLVSAVGFLED